jgi:hypothetical protein
MQCVGAAIAINVGIIIESISRSILHRRALGTILWDANAHICTDLAI